MSNMSISGNEISRKGLDIYHEEDECTSIMLKEKAPIWTWVSNGKLRLQRYIRRLHIVTKDKALERAQWRKRIKDEGLEESCCCRL